MSRPGEDLDLGNLGDDLAGLNTCALDGAAEVSRVQRARSVHGGAGCLAHDYYLLSVVVFSFLLFFSAVENTR